MNIPKRLLEWAEIPGTSITASERSFIESVHQHADKSVGYGWMQQVIEWIWQEKCGENQAWGPEYFNREIKRLREQNK